MRKRLQNLVGYRNSGRNQLANPLNSIGDLRGPVKDGPYMCWEAIGPVREIWRTLGKEIRTWLESSSPLGESYGICTFEIYMIGKSKDTAIPTVLVCSAERSARRQVRKAIEDSGVLSSCPAIRLDDLRQLPDFAETAQEETNHNFLGSGDYGNAIAVFSPPSDNAVGRRLFVPQIDGISQRLATAGPILHVNGKIYQLTVGHVFAQIDDDVLFLSSPGLAACDFDGQSDDEEEVESQISTITEATQLNVEEATVNRNHISTKYMASPKSPNSSIPPSESVEIELSTEKDQIAESHSRSNSAKECHVAKALLPKRLDRIGNLALVADTGTRPSLDYGLVKLEGEYTGSMNEIPFGANINQRWLRILKAASVGYNNINVVTMTASSKFLSGTLCATASYMRLPNQRNFQEVYAVYLKGTVKDGDCGSAIADQLGNFYGHIVAGGIGTGLAYIVPAVDVFEDIVERLAGDVTLMPSFKTAQSKHFQKDRTEFEPLRIIEFGSKHYLNQLPTFSDKKEYSRSNCDEGSKGAGETYNWKHESNIPPRKSKLAGSIYRWRSKFTNSHAEHQKSFDVIKQKGKGKATLKYPGPHLRDSRNPEQTSTITTRGSTIGANFFKLPSPIQTQIIACLSVPDILNLRTVSRRYYNLLSDEEAAISREFLQHNPVPRFAIRLYPFPDPISMNLHYISGLWHRLCVSSSLSSSMAKWITEEHFQRTTLEKRLQFSTRESRLQHRLVPLIFTIFHFFEANSRLRAGLGINNDCPSQVEATIMETYDNDTLLQVHQVFPQFVSYLQRMLRPPSYLGIVERSLRGYRKDPPTENVHAAILYVGGLSKMLEFSRIEGYDARRTAVDHWYDSITTGIDKPLLRHRPTAPYNWQRRRPSLGSSVNSTASSTTSSNMVFSTASLRDGRNDKRLSTSGCSSITEESIESNLSVRPASASHAQALMHNLPQLQHIWMSTAERLLLDRGVIDRKQDIRKNGQLIDELIKDDITDIDELIYGQDIYITSRNEDLGWDGLIDGKGIGNVEGRL